MILNKRNTSYLILTFLIFLLACKSKETYNAQYSYESTMMELKEFIEAPVDSLTQDQIQKRKKLFELVSNKVTVINNQFVSSATVNDFVENGLSKYYYDILEKSVSESNQWVRDEKITNLDSMAQSSRGMIFK